MVKKGQKLPHAEAVKHAKKMLGKGDMTIGEVIEDTQLSHKDVMRIKEK